MNDHTQATLPEVTDHLTDGTTLYIRPINPNDAESDQHFIEALSPESRRFRFLAQIAHPSDKMVEQLTSLNPNIAIALVGSVLTEGAKELIAVARYSVGPGPAECECAVSVMDKWQRHGAGTILMRRLMEIARVRGMESMWSLDYAANASMSAFAGSLGFKRTVDAADASQVFHRCKL
ncbi:MAG: N-acetyltransferase family protein [Stenotrophomonas sp.]